MTRAQKLDNILRNLRDLHRRSKAHDEAQYGKGAESMMSQLIELMEDVVDDLADEAANPTGVQ